MTKAQVLNAKSVAVDGRLENVRTRHVQLKALHDAVQTRSEEILAAVARQSPKLGDATDVLRVSMAATLRSMRILASRLDQKESLKHQRTLQKNRKNALTHTLQVPKGLVGIVALDVAAKPVDALFGPLAGAIAAGCPAVLFLQRGPLAALLKDIFKTALDRDAYVVQEVESPGEAAELSSSCDEVVDVRPKEASEDVVVVDKTLVDERLYRNVSYRQDPPTRLLENLKKVAHAIDEAHGMSTRASPSVHRVLVSEEISAVFQGLLSSPLIVSPYTSTEHLMRELERRPTGKAYVFANEAHGAYLATYAPCQLLTINCIPLDLLVTHLPAHAGVSFSEAVAKGRDDGGFVLDPIWSSSLFSRPRSVVARPVRSLRAIQKSQGSAATATTLVPMKRGKADHMEFFPTGFKITAFPTALLLVSGVGYVGFQSLKHLYLFGRSVLQT